MELPQIPFNYEPLITALANDDSEAALAYISDSFEGMVADFTADELLALTARITDPLQRVTAQMFIYYGTTADSDLRHRVGEAALESSTLIQDLFERRGTQMWTIFYPAAKGSDLQRRAFEAVLITIATMDESTRLEAQCEFFTIISKYRDLPLDSDLVLLAAEAVVATLEENKDMNAPGYLDHFRARYPEETALQGRIQALQDFHAAQDAAFRSTQDAPKPAPITAEGAKAWLTAQPKQQP